MKEDGLLASLLLKLSNRCRNIYYFILLCLLFINCYLKILIFFRFFFFFDRSLLECNCFTMLCQFLLYTQVNQPYAYISSHIPSLLSLLPSSLSHPSRSLQSTKLISLCYAAASHQLTILHSVVYICQCYSHFAKLPPPTLCPQVHSLCRHLYSCPATRFISTTFFFFF